MLTAKPSCFEPQLLLEHNIALSFRNFMCSETIVDIYLELPNDQRNLIKLLGGGHICLALMDDLRRRLRKSINISYANYPQTHSSDSIAISDQMFYNYMITDSFTADSLCPSFRKINTVALNRFRHQLNAIRIVLKDHKFLGPTGNDDSIDWKIVQKKSQDDVRFKGNITELCEYVETYYDQNPEPPAAPSKKRKSSSKRGKKKRIKTQDSKSEAVSIVT